MMTGVEKLEIMRAQLQKESKEDGWDVKMKAAFFFHVQQLVPDGSMDFPTSGNGRERRKRG